MHTLRHAVAPSCGLQGTTEGLPVPPSRKRSRVGSAGPSVSHTTISPTQPPSPNPTSPPKPLPVIHSTAYLQQTKQLVAVHVPLSGVNGSANSSSSRNGSESTSVAVAAAQANLEDNALLWALKKVDEKLYEVEADPSDVQIALYRFSTGPVGQATTQGIQAAAKITMTATMEAAKVAAPVGKWALQQGFKAAVGLAAAAMTAEKEQKQQQNPQQKAQGTRLQQKQGTTKIVKRRDGR